jgi:hypothetical protein
MAGRRVMRSFEGLVLVWMALEPVALVALSLLV